MTSAKTASPVVYSLRLQQRAEFMHWALILAGSTTGKLHASSC
jgi:hypothetical protein